jgi:hypothetical protein
MGLETGDMIVHRQVAAEEVHFSRHWKIILVAAALLISSLGCSLAPVKGLARRIEPLVLAAGPDDAVGSQDSPLATRTPWPTFTPTTVNSPTPVPTGTATPTATPTVTATPTNTPLPTATPVAVALVIPTATQQPVPPVVQQAAAPAPRPATATATATLTPTPSFAYQAVEVYKDHTSNLFLTGYVAIVNYQEIPIGGIKAVGSFEPGGQRYESSLSKWFFDVATAPGAVVKTGSVKFEPGSIVAGTWFIHLEDEWGTRLSEDVPISADPDNPEWFYIKFKQPSSGLPTPALAIAAAPGNASGRGAYSINPTRTIPTPAPTPTRYPTATSVATRAASPDGWAFAGVRSAADQDGLIVYGDVVNDTGSSQQMSQVTGTFYDAQGGVIAGSDDAYDSRPVEVVPSGGRMPFELVVYGIQSAADFDLQVISQSTDETPRQDFEFIGVDTSSTNGSYCVTGKLRNPGDRLSHYLVISAALYNGEDRLINFDSLEVPTPGLVVGDKSLSFSLCIEILDQEVADYEVQAWGK